MIVATCGHVDHGKTLLVHALTGIQTDRLEEEQVRGLTIDLGFAYADFGDQRLGFVDVPGHIRFIDNMLAGVSVIDFGLLVIAADDGPMPQTREHLAIMELLQLGEGAVALTKIDRVNEARVAEVTTAIHALLENTPLAGKRIFPVSSTTGEGVAALAGALVNASAKIESRSITGHFRLAIDRAFTIKGAGIVVTGSVFSGVVKEGDELLLMPHNRRVRVRAIHRQNQASTEGRAGDRCALNIAGTDLTREMIHRGDWLTTNPAPPTARADASVFLLPAEARPLRHWTPVHIHTSANHVTGRVATLESDRIEPGDRSLVQLVMSRPINLCRGDRLIIRDQAASRTIGGGVVVDPVSPARGRAKPERIRHLRALLADSPAARLTGCLAAHPTGVESNAFHNAENLTDGEWRTLAGEIPDTMTLAERIISRSAFEDLSKTLLERLATWHQQHTRSAGASRQQLHGLVDPAVSDGLLDAVVAHLAESGKLSLNGNTCALPEHAVRLSPQEDRLWRQIEPILTEHDTRPPVVHELAKQVARPHKEVQEVLMQCARMGYVVRPAANRFFLPQALSTLRQLAHKVADESKDGLFSVQAYRDASGIGRNLCIEILEYFDRTGLTLRVGDKRKLVRGRED